MATKTKKQLTAKASNGGDVHIGQTLYNPSGQPAKVVKLNGDTATLNSEEDGDFQMPLAQIRAGESAGLIGLTDPHIMDALRSVQGDDDGSDPGN